MVAQLINAVNTTELFTWKWFIHVQWISPPFFKKFICEMLTSPALLGASQNTRSCTLSHGVWVPPRTERWSARTQWQSRVWWLLSRYHHRPLRKLNQFQSASGKGQARGASSPAYSLEGSHPEKEAWKERTVQPREQRRTLWCFQEHQGVMYRIYHSTSGDLCVIGLQFRRAPHHPKSKGSLGKSLSLSEFQFSRL